MFHQSKFNVFLLITLLLLTVTQVQADRNSDIETLFNWAEEEYSELFPSQATTGTVDIWRYRHYPQTDNYTGVNDQDEVWVLGDIFGGMTYVGTLNELLTEVETSHTFSLLHYSESEAVRPLAIIEISVNGPDLEEETYYATLGEEPVELKKLEGTQTLGAIIPKHVNGALNLSGYVDGSFLEIPLFVKEAISITVDDVVNTTNDFEELTNQLYRDSQIVSDDFTKESLIVASEESRVLYNLWESMSFEEKREALQIIRTMEESDLIVSEGSQLQSENFDETTKGLMLFNSAYLNDIRSSSNNQLCESEKYRAGYRMGQSLRGIITLVAFGYGGSALVAPITGGTGAVLIWALVSQNTLVTLLSKTIPETAKAYSELSECVVATGVNIIQDGSQNFSAQTFKSQSVDKIAFKAQRTVTLRVKEVFDPDSEPGLRPLLNRGSTLVNILKNFSFISSSFSILVDSLQKILDGFSDDSKDAAAGSYIFKSSMDIVEFNYIWLSDGLIEVTPTAEKPENPAGVQTEIDFEVEVKNLDGDTVRKVKAVLNTEYSEEHTSADNETSIVNYLQGYRHGLAIYRAATGNKIREEIYEFDILLETRKFSESGALDEIIINSYDSVKNLVSFTVYKYYPDGITVKFVAESIFVNNDQSNPIQVKYAEYRSDSTLRFQGLSEVRSDGTLISKTDTVYHADGISKSEEYFNENHNGQNILISFKKYSGAGLLSESGQISYNSDWSPSGRLVKIYYGGGHTVYKEIKSDFVDGNYIDVHVYEFYESGAKHIYETRDEQGLPHGPIRHWRKDGSLYKINHRVHGRLVSVTWYKANGSIDKECNHRVFPVECS